MRYRPCASVTTERTCSINAGLLASTVTPGSTPPEGSRTTPVRLLCAHATAGAQTTAQTTKEVVDSDRIRSPATVNGPPLASHEQVARRGPRLPARESARPSRH